MNTLRTYLMASAALLALPLSAFAHPGATHQHNLPEVIVVGGIVLLVTVVIGVMHRRTAKAPDAKDPTQQNQ